MKPSLPCLLSLLPPTLAALPALAWEARPLQELAVYPERSAQAQVVSLNESRVAAELSARILRLLVEPGQRVARGALIAELDCHDYDLAVEAAQASLAASEARVKLATVQHDRTVRLAGDNFVSRDVLDARVAELDAAKADVAVSAAASKTARASQAKCRVHAPFPAIVQERLAQEGEMANPGAPLAVLLDTSRIQVKAEVQEADAAGLAAARDIAFIGPSGGHRLSLLRLSPALTRTTRLLEARLRFVTRPAPAGSSGRIIWKSPLPHLPPSLVVRRAGGLGVFVADGDKPRFHALPEAQEGRPAAAFGLKPDSRIVAGGMGDLR